MGQCVGKGRLDLKKQIDDKDIWEIVDSEDLWLFDKLILSKKLGYMCGPAGVTPPKTGPYIVRPCVNYRMMSAGASIEYLSDQFDNLEKVPHGYFWCELFKGRHLSFDYKNSKQELAVEGFKHNNFKRFLYWRKVSDEFVLPDFLLNISKKYEWLNVEVIGNKIIEVHLRPNDDFRFHDGNIVVPVWQDEYIDKTKTFYESKATGRKGFYVIK